MSERISDSIKLLGLIVKTKPFTFTDNTVECSYSTHVDVADLKAMKKNIEDEFKSLSSDSITDEVRMSYDNDIYFLTTVIIELESKI